MIISLAWCWWFAGALAFARFVHVTFLCFVHDFGVFWAYFTVTVHKTPTRRIQASAQSKTPTCRLQSVVQSWGIHVAPMGSFLPRSLWPICPVSPSQVITVMKSRPSLHLRGGTRGTWASSGRGAVLNVIKTSGGTMVKPIRGMEDPALFSTRLPRRVLEARGRMTTHASWEQCCHSLQSTRLGQR